MSVPNEMDSIDVVRVKEGELRCFETFIELKEKENVGRSDGVFKIMFDSYPQSRRATVTEMLKCVMKNFETVDVQTFLEPCKDSNMYLFRKRQGKQFENAAFKAQALQESSYCEETCCSEILDVDSLVNHYFEDVIKVKAQALHHSALTFEELKSKMLKEGVRFRENYNTVKCKVLQGNYVQEAEPSSCMCLDCTYDNGTCDFYPDTDDETQSGQTLDPLSIYYGAGVNAGNNCNPIWIMKDFSLSRLTNILMSMKYHYDGLSCPYFYVGHTHSLFPLHIEDASLWSINFLHLGQSKIWFVIPPRALLLLNLELQSSDLPLAETSCHNILGHKTSLPSPQWLKERHIPFKVVVQRPGEAVVLYPNAAHFGFNMGWNLAEAINFGTISWIPEGINALKCVCIPGQIHLDMSQFVGMFRPELIDQYLSRVHIKTVSRKQMVAFLHESFQSVPSTCKRTLSSTTRCEGQHESPVYHKKIRTFGSYFFNCPVPICPKKYPSDKKKNLVKHVLNKHKPLVIKYQLLEKIDVQCLELKKMRQDSMRNVTSVSD